MVEQKRCRIEQSDGVEKDDSSQVSMVERKCMTAASEARNQSEPIFACIIKVK